MLVKGLVIKGTTPSRNPCQVSPQLWVLPVGKGEVGPLGEGAQPGGGGCLTGIGQFWGRVPPQGRGASQGEEHVLRRVGRGEQQGRGRPVGGGASPRGRDTQWEEGHARGRGTTAVANTFSPGLHGPGLTGVQVPDIVGWVNKELKLWQH